MNRNAISFLAASALLFSLITATAQKQDKPWTDWSKKDAEKMLNDSPWAQTQTDTDTSQMFYSPTTDPRITGAPNTSTTDARLGAGATNQAVNVKFHVRFFSARPVRQALARIMELEQKPAPEVIARLHSFAELKSTNSIIMTVSFESNDQRYSGPVMQAFNSAVTGTLKNNTYLERSDGEHLFLEEYMPPGKDGFGARFIFLRLTKDERPFITEQAGEIRFYAEFSDKLKMNMRFKVADMLYEGALEY